MANLDFEGFAAYLLQRDRRKTTIHRHLTNLRYLGKHLAVFDYPDIEKFLLKLKGEGKVNSYLNIIVNTIRLYAQYLNLDPKLQKYHQFKKTTSIKSTMSDDEVEAFLALPCPRVIRHLHGKEISCPTDPKNWQIWTLFFSICAFTGMRPGEVAHLKVSDVDFGRGVFCIRQSKTNQPGIAPIPNNIKDLVREYLVNLTSDYLFPSKQGGNHYSCGNEAVFDNVDWHYQFHRRINLLGIKRERLTPYSFRHSYATRLLEENISLFHVKKLMRHNDLKSTLVYEHLTTKDLIEAQSKLPLIRKGTDPHNILNCLVEIVKSLHLEKDVRFSYISEEREDFYKFEVKIK